MNLFTIYHELNKIEEQLTLEKFTKILVQILIDEVMKREKRKRMCMED